MFTVFSLFGGGFFHGYTPKLRSGCGVDFDEYVKRAIDVNESYPYRRFERTFRIITNLWKDRKLRIYKNPTDYQEGQVVSWHQQNDGFSNQTDWWITIIFTGPLQVGDTAIITVQEDDTKLSNYDGKKCKIVKCLANSKYKVIPLNDAEGLKFLTIKGESLQKIAEFSVVRMNVDGGGILTPNEEEFPTDSDLDSDTNLNLSLEWIDPASPTINLHEDKIMKANATCPTCRAVEPTMIAFDDYDNNKIDSNKKMDDTKASKMYTCPICTEKSLCRTLQCGHRICTHCWIQWRSKGKSKIPSSVAAPVVDEQTLQKERDRNFQKLRAIAPHTLGGTATRPSGGWLRGSTQEAVDAAKERYVEKMKSILENLAETLEDHHDTEEQEGQAFSKFWRELLTIPIQVFCHFIIFMIEGVDSYAVLEILMQVIEVRSDEICTALQHSLPINSSNSLGDITETPVTLEYPSEPVAKSFVLRLLGKCCEQMAIRYDENNEDPHGIIHWWERSILHTQKIVETGIPGRYSKYGLLSRRYSNLGLAQQEAGYVVQAKESLDKSLDYFTTHVIEDREARVGITNLIFKYKAKVEEQLQSWIGTSGRLTPGLK